MALKVSLGFQTWPGGWKGLPLGETRREVEGRSGGARWTRKKVSLVQVVCSTAVLSQTTPLELPGSSTSAYPLDSPLCSELVVPGPRSEHQCF